jgi:hypothetical protein
VDDVCQLLIHVGLEKYIPGKLVKERLGNIYGNTGLFMGIDQLDI